MTNYDVLLSAFQAVGIKVEEHDERHNTWKNKDSVPKQADKYLSVEIAHFHFTKEGVYLGAECNGDGAFIQSLNQ